MVFGDVGLVVKFCLTVDFLRLAVVEDVGLGVKLCFLGFILFLACVAGLQPFIGVVFSLIRASEV